MAVHWLLLPLLAAAQHGADTGPADPLEGLSEKARVLLSLLVVLALAMVVTNICHKAHVPVPEAIIVVVIGGVAGAVAWSPLVPSISEDFFLKFEDGMALDFMLVLIAPIIFAEGYGMKSRKFFENITRILLHAFAGTTISAIVVAVMVHYLAPLTGFRSLKMTECLCFGALISATDPVTTLAIFKDMNMVGSGLGHLYYSVLGESILNDAVGITLFDGFAEFVKKGEDLSLEGVGQLVGSFCLTFFGSMALGIVFGILTAGLLKLGRLGEAAGEEDQFHFNVPEIGTMLVMSYLPFLVATSIPPLSGIVAVLFAGVASRHYAHYNLTVVTREAFIPFVELLASLSEMYVFLLLGMGIFVLERSWYSPSLILWTALACLVGRAAQVYPLGGLANCCSRGTKLSLRELHVVWFAGLRGAVAFMCALAFPGENRGYVVSTTIIIAFVSMVCMGWPTPQVLRCLKVQGRAPIAEGAPRKAVSELKAGPEKWAARAVGERRLSVLNSKLKSLVMTKDAIAERQAHADEVARRCSGELSDGRSVPLCASGALESGVANSQQESVVGALERGTFERAAPQRQRSGLANM